MIKYVRRNSRGLTLVEVLMSLGILSVGILAVVGVFPGVFKMNRDSWVTTRIMLTAQDKMDQILADNKFIDTDASVDYPDIIPRDEKGDPMGYRKWWGDSYAAGDNMQNVRVEVVWIEGGRTKRFNLIGAVSP